MTTFSKRLKELRKKKKLTQKELANKLNVVQSKVSDWENGNLEPSLENLSNLAMQLQTNVDYLLGLSDNDGVIDKNSEKIDMFANTLGTIITGSKEYGDINFWESLFRKENLSEEEIQERLLFIEIQKQEFQDKYDNILTTKEPKQDK
ncbi:helix-turn-helix domain-containing protein [Lactococcus garvieae]|uniref:helix-turn-helix domain-containing protein n=1 Tax=Lactococcus garvieae TaxID=1363 RepID=UPI0002D455B7|nr:helix-turn-helix transcriptional regulator [Lactococcus garvieae]